MGLILICLAVIIAYTSGGLIGKGDMDTGDIGYWATSGLCAILVVVGYFWNRK